MSACFLAVLEKKFSSGINNFDAYVNVVGGVKLTETACDLAILTAVFSSLRDIPVRPGRWCWGSRTDGRDPAGQPNRSSFDRSRAFRIYFRILPGGNKAGLERTRENTVGMPERIYVDTVFGGDRYPLAPSRKENTK